MSMRGPYHQQKPDSLREIISEYDSELAELTFNSKPIINNLTIVAGENIHASEQIAKLIEHRLTSAHMKRKLPFLYLTDSIVKNIGGVYHQLFSSNIDMLFLNVYEKADEPTRQSLHRLLSTWPPIFPEKVPLIEERIKLMPLSPTAEEASAPSTAPKIHVNPRYLARRQEVERGHGPGRLDEMLASSEWEQQQMRRRVSPPSRSGRPSWRDQQRGYHARSDGSHGVSRGAVGHSAFPPGSPSFNVGGGEASFLQPQNTQLASLLGTIPQDLIVQETQTLILRLEQQIRDQLQGGTLSPNEQLELLKQLQQLKTLQQQALQLQTTTSSAYPATPAFGTTPLPLQLQLPATTFHPRQYPDITQLAASLMGSSALPSTTAATPTTTTPAAAAAAASSPATSLSPFASLDTSNLLHSLTTLGIISPFGGGPPQSTSIPTQPIPTALPLSLPTALPATPHSLPQPTAAIPPARHHAAPPPIHQQPPIKRPRLDSGSTSTAAESSRGRPGLNKLYSPSASQCATCGLRFTDKEKMGKHLDWHFAMNCKEKEKIKKPLSRTWYLTAEDWTMNVEVADKSVIPFFGAEAESVSEEEATNVPLSSVVADEAHSQCPICGEGFVQFWDSEREEWMYRDAIQPVPDQAIYHVKCYSSQPGSNSSSSPSSSSVASAASFQVDSTHFTSNASEHQGQFSLPSGITGEEDRKDVILQLSKETTDSSAVAATTTTAGSTLPH